MINDNPTSRPNVVEVREALRQIAAEHQECLSLKREIQTLWEVIQTHHSGRTTSIPHNPTHVIEQGKLPDLRTLKQTLEAEVSKLNAAKTTAFKDRLDQLTDDGPEQHVKQGGIDPP